MGVLFREDGRGVRAVHVIMLALWRSGAAKRLLKGRGLNQARLQNMRAPHVSKLHDVRVGNKRVGMRGEEPHATE